MAIGLRVQIGFFTGNYIEIGIQYMQIVMKYTGNAIRKRDRMFGTMNVLLK